MRAALLQSGFAFPHDKRITVNLAPADLPKESGRFDLPIALGILAAAGAIDPQRLEAFEFAGELSLAGELRPVRGALALALAVRHADHRRCLVLPSESAQAAARVGALDIRAADSLLQVVQSLQPGDDAPPLPQARPLPAAPAAVEDGALVVPRAAPSSCSTMSSSQARPGSLISARSRSSRPGSISSTRQKSSASPTRSWSRVAAAAPQPDAADERGRAARAPPRPAGRSTSRCRRRCPRSPATARAGGASHRRAALVGVAGCRRPSPGRWAAGRSGRPAVDADDQRVDDVGVADASAGPGATARVEAEQALRAGRARTAAMSCSRQTTSLRSDSTSGRAMARGHRRDQADPAGSTAAG